MTSQSVPTRSDRTRSTLRWVWIVVGVALIALAISLAMVNLDETQSSSEFGGASRLELDISNGPVTIRAVEGAPGIEIDYTSTSGRLGGMTRFVTSADGSTVTIVQRCPWIVGFGCRASFIVTVPADADVSGRTGNGAISVTGLSGDIEVSTSNGAVTLEGLTGDLTVRTSNGAVVGTGIGSPEVEITTSNGRVELGFTEVPVNVVAQTSNGPIDIGLPGDSPPVALETRTSNGRVEANIRTDPAATSRIAARTSNGNITVSYR